MLKEIDPCRAAGCQDRQTDTPVPVQIPCQAVQHLGSLLHDCKVCSEVSVEYIVEAELPQGGDHLAGNKCTRLHAEFLSYGSPHSRRGLHYDDFVRVGKVLDKPVGMVTLGKCPDRTYGHALSAICTFALGHHLVECRCYCSIEAPPYCTEGPDSLHFVAHCLTAAAEYAFVHIPDDGSRHFPLARGQLSAVERHFPYIEPQGQVLQVAVSGLRAGQAFVRMVGKDELGNYFPGIHHTERTRTHHHPFGTFRGTGRGKVSASLDLYNADTA